MTEISPTLVSPILRLDAFVWSALSYYLDSGDVMQLYFCGSKLLTDRLRQGVRHLRVNCRKSGYIRFQDVFSSCRRFKSLVSFDFNTLIDFQLYYTPVEWSQLPQQLTSLKLSFFDPLDALRDIQNAWPPQLENLEILNPSNAPLWPFRSFDLSHLPRSLRKLRLLDHHLVFVIYDHFKMLPQMLEELQFECRLRLTDPETFINLPSQNASSQPAPDLLMPKIRLPSLPTNLKLLRMRDPANMLHVDAASLPSSLTHFEINDGWHVYAAADFDSDTAKSIDLTGASACLPHLRTLSVARLGISVQEAREWIPPSVTRLNVRLTGQFEKSEIMSYSSVLNALEHYLCSGHDDVELDFDGSFPFLGLKSVSPYCDGATVIPPSVTELFTSFSQCPTQLPQGLVSFTLDYGDDYEGDLRDTLASVSFHSCSLLQTMDLTYSSNSDLLDVKCIDILPNTLTCLTAGFHLSGFEYLLQSMTIASKFPKLVFISSLANLPLKFTQHFPSQLKRLCLRLAPEGDELGGDDESQIIPQSFLLHFQNSFIEHLDINFDEYRMVRAPRKAQRLILQHLPKGLSSLRVLSPHHLSPFEEIVFPSTLRTLDFDYAGSDNCNGQQEISSTPKGPFSLVLPSLLAVLIIFKQPFVPEFSWYPQQLSCLRLTCDPQTEQDYWNARHPSLKKPSPVQRV